LDKEISKAKQIYIKKIETKLSENKYADLWRHLNNILGRNRPSQNRNSSYSADEFNSFYAIFEQPIPNSFETKYEIGKQLANGINISKIDGIEAITELEVYKELRKIKLGKSAGPDGITSRMLKTFSDELAPIFTIIFNRIMSTCLIPDIWKLSTIIPIPKNKTPNCLNDFRPIALTSIVMKCFEKLLLFRLKIFTNKYEDKLQFAYREHTSATHACATLIHHVTEWIDTPNHQIRLLFVDFSSAFNTILPWNLFEIFKAWKVPINLIMLIMEFLINRKQVVKYRDNLSKSITTNTGAPQG
jgi:hypothetical protein